MTLQKKSSVLTTWRRKPLRISLPSSGGSLCHTQFPLPCYPVIRMPSCLKCGTALAVNEEGVAPVLCDRCAGVATGRARRSMAIGGLGGYPVTTALMALNIPAYIGQVVSGQALTYGGVNAGPLTLSGEYWRLFTAGFLHGGILHIAVNLWCLW